MSQFTAPQIIRIKRKRDDTPLESLYLENGDHKEKRRITNAFVFKRVDSGEPKLPQPVQDNGIPVVRTTLPGEEIRNPLALKSGPTTKPKAPMASATPRSAPRRFQLARPRIPLLLPTSSTIRKKRSEVAVFVEKRPRLTQPPVQYISSTQNGDSRTTNTLSSMEVGEQENTPKLKRPSATSRLHRGTASLKPTGVDDALNERDPAFLSEISAWAEETEKAEISAKPPPAMKAVTTEPVIRGSDEDLEMNDADSDGDYVYDTYIRHVVSANSVPALDAAASVGHLVINEEDEELWQTYIDDDDDEREFDTDEEDSNAEDYYGADYPEDEVDDDDEYDRDAYKYRKGTSDDEEWDVENDDVVWSDEEGEPEFSGGKKPLDVADYMVE